MQHSTENLGIRLVAAMLMSFVLVGAQLFHSVLDSILMFAGLLTGEADYGYLDWLGALGWSAFGNLVGGLVLVTGIRLLRIPHRIAESREQGQTGWPICADCGPSRRLAVWRPICADSATGRARGWSPRASGPCGSCR